jgi:transposase-like protein
MRAVRLYIRYDRSSAATIRELGYPSRKALYRWWKEYQASGDLHDAYPKEPRFSAEQKKAAVDYYVEHGRNLSATVRALGYPSRTLLAQWIDQLRPGFRKVSVRAGRAVVFSVEQKRRAVIDLCSRDTSAETVAESVGVSRQTLYAWTWELLEEKPHGAMSAKKRDAASDDRDKLFHEVEVLEKSAGSDLENRRLVDTGVEVKVKGCQGLLWIYAAFAKSSVELFGVPTLHFVVQEHGEKGRVVPLLFLCFFHPEL